MAPPFFADINNKDSYVMLESTIDYGTNGFGREDKEVFL